MSDYDEAQRGQLAQQVLDNPVYSDAYATLEAELTRKWRESRDRDEREHVHQMLRMLDKTRSVIEGVMRSGKLAESEIARKKTLAERVGLRRVS